MRTALPAIAAMALAPSAAADVIQQTQSFGPSTPNFTTQLSFDRFDDMGGTRILTAVTWNLSVEVIGGEFNVDNDGADPATVNARLGATFSIGSDDVLLAGLAATATNSGEFNLAGNDGDSTTAYDFGGADHATLTGVGTSAAETVMILDALFFQYLGTSPLIVSLDAVQIADVGSVGGISFAGSPVLASGSVSLDYDFITIPAPAGLAAIGLGLGGLARRRR